MTADQSRREELTGQALLAAWEQRWTAHLAQTEQRWDQHQREHEQMEVQLERAHAAATDALKAALADHHREHEVHAAAHDREHLAHQREHTLNDTAVANAARAVDQRLEGMNEFRDQLREQARQFATAERVDQLQASIGTQLAQATKHTDERYEENRRRIEVIEKGDVKAEGRTLGQGAVIAIIVTAIGVVGTVLAIIVALANLATAQ